MPKWTYLHHCQ